MKVSLITASSLVCNSTPVSTSLETYLIVFIVPDFDHSCSVRKLWTLTLLALTINANEIIIEVSPSQLFSHLVF